MKLNTSSKEYSFNAKSSFANQRTLTLTFYSLPDLTLTTETNKAICLLDSRGQLTLCSLLG